MDQTSQSFSYFLFKTVCDGNRSHHGHPYCKYGHDRQKLVEIAMAFQHTGRAHFYYGEGDDGWEAIVKVPKLIENQQKAATPDGEERDRESLEREIICLQEKLNGMEQAYRDEAVRVKKEWERALEKSMWDTDAVAKAGYESPKEHYDRWRERMLPDIERLEALKKEVGWPTNT